MYQLRFAVLIIALVTLISLTFSQKGFDEKTSEQRNPLKTMDINIDQQKIDLQNMDILKQIEPEATTATIYNDQLLEGAVDADKYIVGPNDIFALGVWGIVNQPLPLAVSPEGTLIIPSVGEVDIDGLTLTAAKEKVIAATKKRFISAVITLTLVSPRRFMVTLTGVGQGTYPTSAIMRASTIIAFVINDSVSLGKSRTSFGDRHIFSLRNITLKRKNGETQRVDLYKYYASRDERYNPFLREGDVINIPKYDWEGRFLSVYGAVQFPGNFEYIEGDNLETAIELVRGATSMANTDSILISRLEPGANKMNNFYVSLERDKDMKLEPNDRVVVSAYSEQRRDFKVHILGEVMKPGGYPITLNSTRLTEIIKEAGGPTPNSYLPNSEVYRKLDTFFIVDKNRDSLESVFTKRLNDVITNKDEKENFDLDIKYKIGRVNIDFDKLSEGDESQDVTLRDGDIIYISSNKKEVYVYGQINKPGFVPYKEGADVDYYIAACGGYGDRADEDEVRVVKFKTREWLEPDETKIHSSDFIYVPKIIKRDFAYDIDLIAKVASVIVSVVTLTLLVIQSQK